MDDSDMTDTVIEFILTKSGYFGLLKRAVDNTLVTKRKTIILSFVKFSIKMSRLGSCGTRYYVYVNVDDVIDFHMYAVKNKIQVEVGHCGSELFSGKSDILQYMIEKMAYSDDCMLESILGAIEIDGESYSIIENLLDSLRNNSDSAIYEAISDAICNEKLHNIKILNKILKQFQPEDESHDEFVEFITNNNIVKWCVKNNHLSTLKIVYPHDEEVNKKELIEIATKKGFGKIVKFLKQAP